ncbi:heme-binding protein [Embleya sp. NBC_00896]|uniref:GlcG/HbpS family heme-binding protein n=1 Tax=Embleya sp. NBC_00896 TaxID=2975961 RepID=UPI002F90E4E7|nr:heme-binding protein [Embleya sp. NBC_00896]
MKKPLSLRTRTAVGAAVLVLGLSMAGGTPAIAAPHRTWEAPVAGEVKDGNVVQTSHLTEEAAVTAAQAALDAAEADGRRVSVAVVDRNGNTIVVLRGDGSGAHTYESAQRKAYTAASFNAPTSVLVGRLEQNPTLADIPGTLFLAGGLPIHYQGAPIAGIGVAGAPSGLLDEQYAQAGIDAISN